MFTISNIILNFIFKFYLSLKRKGRKSAAQTPAPQNERVYGSDKNPIGSAASQTSASKIKLSPGILTTLKNKVDKYNERHKKKVSLATAKAVMRRGMGAYSKSHRPTITGGAPNSRQAWGFARVNKFLLKKSGEPVKKAYVQDDDLLAQGGQLGENITCVRCGWGWNTKDSDESDKYVCHKCGFDNRTYYDSDIIGKAESDLSAAPEQIKTENIEQMENIEPIMVDCEIVETELPVGKLAKGMTLSEVAAHHGLKAEDLQKAINDGIETEMEHTDSSEIARAIALDHLYEDPKYYDKLKEIEKPNQKAEGGHVMDDDGNLTNDGKKGGYFKGRSHAEGGIKAVNVDTKTPIEVEGDEVIITKSAVRDPKKRNFEGKMMTNREILSKINQSGGGVAFAEGGETSDCGCNQYDEGGKTESDIAIMSCKEIEVLLDGLFKLSVQAPELIDSIKENIIYLKKLQIVQNC